MQTIKCHWCGKEVPKKGICHKYCREHCKKSASEARRKAGVKLGHRKEYNPTPEEIAAACAEIRSKWSPGRERAARCYKDQPAQCVVQIVTKSRSNGDNNWELVDAEHYDLIDGAGSIPGRAVGLFKMDPK